MSFKYQMSLVRHGVVYDRDRLSINVGTTKDVECFQLQLQYFHSQDFRRTAFVFHSISVIRNTEA